ncbi:hypothetical protein GH714_022893 [Hevea brasiliensis]|uniref:Uncharacterized protein n=1 Tax=Hevea brasiliensis TaxID=3981 RepID=A0A6A6KUZ2_HEVBR|nr:hypothetical protein GH714_022893 [Hevea brasiliensis]
MPSLSCLFKNPLSWMSVLVLVLAAFLGFGFSSSILLTALLILSPLFFKFSKQKPKLVEKSVTSDQEKSDCCLYRSSTSDQVSEADFSVQDKTFWSPDCSDGSISDEESLIEIALPSGHYIGHKEGFNLQKKLPDFTTAGSLFKQHGLMELLAEINEMNEEENLIEIDISMGSIKCPRFEIEA